MTGRLDQTGHDIIAAAEYMAAHGQCKRKLEGLEGNVCVMGALYRVVPKTRQSAAFKRVLKAIEMNGHKNGIAHWNSRTSKDEVIDDLVAAAYLDE